MINKNYTLHRFTTVAIVMLILLTTGSPLTADDERDDELGTNIIIIFDTSGSMRKGKLEIAKSAVDTFIQSLKSDVNLGLIIFNPKGGPEIASPLKFSDEISDDKRVEIHQSILKKVKSLEAYGPTPLANCMKVCAKILLPRIEEHPYERDIVLLVTDGKDTVTGPKSVAPMMEKLTDHGITVSLIAFETKENDYLRKFATKFFQPNNKSELTAALNETLTEAKTFTAFQD